MSAYSETMWPQRTPVSSVACITMARDEEFFLEIWVKHYLALIPDAQLFILDHASEKPVSDFIKEAIGGEDALKVTIIRLPDFPFDDDYKAAALSSLANILIHGYRCVVISDADEIVVPIDRNVDLSVALMNSVAECTAPLGFEPVERRGEERPFDPSAPVFDQRSYGFFTSGYSKPCIWRNQGAISAGLHKATLDFEYSDDLLLVHLRSVDEKMSLERARRRREVSLSNNQNSKGYGATWKTPSDKKISFFTKLESIKQVIDASDIVEEFKYSIKASRSLRGKMFGHDISLTSEMCDIRSVLRNKHPVRK